MHVSEFHAVVSKLCCKGIETMADLVCVCCIPVVIHSLTTISAKLECECF